MPGESHAKLKAGAPHLQVRVADAEQARKWPSKRLQLGGHASAGQWYVCQQPGKRENVHYVSGLLGCSRYSFAT